MTETAAQRVIRKINAKVSTPSVGLTKEITEVKEGSGNAKTEQKTRKEISSTPRKIMVKKAAKPKEPPTQKVVKISKKVKQPGPRRKVRTNIDKKREAEDKHGQGEQVSYGRQMLQMSGYNRKKK